MLPFQQGSMSCPGLFNSTIVDIKTYFFAATAGTNTRNAAFKIVHSELLNISQKFISNGIMSTV